MVIHLGKGTNGSSILLDCEIVQTTSDTSYYLQTCDKKVNKAYKKAVGVDYYKFVNLGTLDLNSVQTNLMLAVIGYSLGSWGRIRRHSQRIAQGRKIASAHQATSRKRTCQSRTKTKEETWKTYKTAWTTEARNGRRRQPCSTWYEAGERQKSAAVADLLVLLAQ